MGERMKDEFRRSVKMKTTCCLIIAILSFFIVNTYTSAGVPNLLDIEHISPKGRVQDKEYNKNSSVIDELIEMNKSAIPFLISRLESKKPLQHGVIDLWYYAEERHLALIILTYFFLDQTWKKSTLPSFCFSAIIESKKYPGMPACEIINEHFNAEQWKALQQRWLAMWETNKDQIYWDSEGKFFRIEGLELKSCE
jgi:hypothetical protein